MKQMLWDGPDFSLAQTLESGQCFRFEKNGEDCYMVMAGKRRGIFAQEGGKLFLCAGKLEDIPFWRRYFDLERDYAGLKKTLAAGDSVMAEAISFAPGIRLLRQEFFETLISFILSQNNHIPRIRGLIGRLCMAYGEEIDGGYFAFPMPDALAQADEESLRRLGTGFRAGYLVDAVKKVRAGGYTPEEMKGLETDELRGRLMEIRGVGRKVADCVLLFSLGRYEVFPADVWIRRVMEAAYSGGEPLSPVSLQALAAGRFGASAGFAQQYLFYYGRMKKIGANGLKK